MSASTLRLAPAIVRSSDQAATDVRVVGGKAAGLARLLRAGLRVPPWFTVPADALDSRLRDLGSRAAVVAALRHADDPLDHRGLDAALLDDLAPDDTLRAAIAESLQLLGPGPYAVRSSAPDEDGAHRSFAGQLETVLGPCDVEAICTAIARCWRSAFAAHVLDYRRRAGSLGNATRLAVIVQRLVLGEVSGVLFTRDPIGGDAPLMRASATWGLGELLVSGEGDADELLFDRGGHVRSRRVAHKPTRRTVREGACVAEPVERDARDACTLDDDAVLALAAAGRAIVAAEGAERDVEWTIADGTLYLLQARPITTAAPPVHERRIVWDNSNIQESYSGVTTPLTFSFASAAYASVYEQTMRTVGIDEATIAAHRPLLRGLLGLLRGRVYYNLNAWYQGLLLLPAFGRNKADMERMMGVDEPVDFVVDDAPQVLRRAARAPAMLRTIALLGYRFARLQRDVPRFLADFESGLARVDRGGAGSRSLGALMADLDTLRTHCLERWSTPIVNDFRVMMTGGRLRRIVERAAPGNADRLLPALLAGVGGEASAGPAAIFLELAALARNDPALARAIADGQPAAALTRSGAASPAFATLLAALYERWGDRCIGELKLESRRLGDDPAFVVGILRGYLAGDAPHPGVVAERVERARAAAVEVVEGALGALGRRRFRQVLRAARQCMHDRERMRLARTRMFGAHRDVYRAIGARLAEYGRIEAAEHVFFLTVDEIRGWWEGTTASAELRPLVRARRAEFAAYEGDSPPNRVVTVGAPHEHRFTGPAAVRADEHVLQGLGCSAGVAIGRVRVVTGPTGGLSLAGRVLVAARTDPGWSPLFPGAAAIVVERGSLLSHSAVLARELGLPAVVGIPDVTRTLRDGELVRVDGAAGTVERLEQR